MLSVPIVGVIKKGSDDEPEVQLWEDFAAMFAPPPYDPQEALIRAKTLLPGYLQDDQYYLSLALIFANVSGMREIWPRYFKPGDVDIPGLKKNVLRFLSSGELFMVKLALHLFNDSNKLPSDGLLGLRNLDNYHFELAMHALRVFTRGSR